MEAITRTTERIYTFPIPLPMPLMSDGVSRGETEIKDVTRFSVELWHVRFGHVSEDLVRNTADMHINVNISRKYRTNLSVQPEKCEYCVSVKLLLRES